MPRKKPMPLKEALKVLKASGVNLTDPSITLAQLSDYDQRDVKQVWRCRWCPEWEYESPVLLTGLFCERGHRASKTWPK